MTIPLLQGRDFKESDAKQESTVAIVHRAFAEHFFPGTSAIGKRLSQGTGPQAKLTIQIVGVVADALYEGPREGVHRQVYLPNWGNNSSVFYLRAQTPSSSAFNGVRDDVRQLDAGIPVYDLKTVEAQLDETLLSDRLVAMLSAGFGAVATLLVVVATRRAFRSDVAGRFAEVGS